MEDVIVTKTSVVLSIGSNQFLVEPKDAIEVMEILMGADQVESHWPKADDNDKRSHRVASWPGSISISQITGEVVTRLETAQIKQREKLAKEREEAAASPEAFDDASQAPGYDEDDDSPVAFEEIE